MDGTGGRGFYTGLDESLQHILEKLAAAPGVSDLLRIAEGIFCPVGASGVSSYVHKNDFLVAGVWKPVTTVLAERFHGMFSVGVAVAMHRAFTAIEKFTREIPRVFLLNASNGNSSSNGGEGRGGGGNSANAAYARLCRHSDVVAFRNKWKLDLYFQVSCVCIGYLLLYY